MMAARMLTQLLIAMERRMEISPDERDEFRATVKGIALFAAACLLAILIRWIL